MQNISLNITYNNHEKMILGRFLVIGFDPFAFVIISKTSVEIKFGFINCFDVNEKGIKEINILNKLHDYNDYENISNTELPYV